MVYRLDFPVAIESHTGLTDRTVARQEVDRRGRPGHEKRPSIEYLAGQRRAHLTFMPAAPQLLELRGRIPEVIVDFGQGVRGRVLHWDPELMAELGRRGARFPYFTAELDRFIPRLDRLTDKQVAHNYQMLELFYFRHVDDPVREQAFLRRLRSSPRD